MQGQDFPPTGSLGPSSQQIITTILSNLFAISSTSSEQNVQNVAERISQILKNQLIYTPNFSAGLKKPLITLALIFSLLSFTLQLTWLTVGLTHCRLSISHWVVRKNELGLLVPNTRYLLAILNVIFTILLVSETALLTLNLKETSALKYRAINAGSMWLPLWFSSWVYTWGIGTGIYISISKMPKGILGKLIDWKHSAQAFNTLVVGSLLVGATYGVSILIHVAYDLMMLLDSHDRIVSRFEMMAFPYDPQNFSIQNEILQGLPDLLDLVVSFENWKKKLHFLIFSRSVSFFVFICLSIPLYYVFFIITRGTKNHYCDVVTFNAGYLDDSRRREENVPAYSADLPVSQAPKSSLISVIWKFLVSDTNHVVSAAILSVGHTMVELIVTARFIYILKQSVDANMLVKSLTNSAVLNNFIFAFTGLLSSWLFYKRSQSSHLEMFMKPDNLNSLPTLTLPDMYDPWSLTSPIISDNFEFLPGTTRVARYSVRVRPQLRNFPDICYVKEYLLTEDMGDCHVAQGLEAFPQGQQKLAS